MYLTMDSNSYNCMCMEIYIDAWIVGLDIAMVF